MSNNGFSPFRIWVLPSPQIPGAAPYPLFAHLDRASTRHAAQLVETPHKSHAGAHVLHIALVTCDRGLSATYFDDANLSSPVYVRNEVPSQFGIGGDGAGGDMNSTKWPGKESQPMSGASFAVRWEGYIQVSTSSTYTFISSLTSADERVRMWIDRQLILDNWNSLSTLHSYIPYAIPPSAKPLLGMIDVKIEYKEHNSSHGHSLQWFKAGTSPSPIPAAHFCRGSGTLVRTHFPSVIFCHSGSGPECTPARFHNATLSGTAYPVVIRHCESMY